MVCNLSFQVLATPKAYSILSRPDCAQLQERALGLVFEVIADKVPRGKSYTVQNSSLHLYLLANSGQEVKTLLLIDKSEWCLAHLGEIDIGACTPITLS